MKSKKSKTPKATITFATPAQAAIFRNEITGQLSDGAWENSKPDNHWVFWSDLEVRVGGPIGITYPEGFYKQCNQKRGYNLITLVDEGIVDLSDRMRAYAAAANAGMEGLDCTVAEYVCEFGSYEAFVKQMNANGGEYWTRMIPLITPENAALLLVAYNNYTRKDLLKDLRVIKEAMKTDAKPLTFTQAALL